MVFPHPPHPRSVSAQEEQALSFLMLRGPHTLLLYLFGSLQLLVFLPHFLLLVPIEPNNKFEFLNLDPKSPPSGTNYIHSQAF